MRVQMLQLSQTVQDMQRCMLNMQVMHAQRNAELHSISDPLSQQPMTGQFVVESLTTALSKVTASMHDGKNLNLTKVKDTDNANEILILWASELSAIGVQEKDWVRKVIPCMLEGGNLRKWASQYFATDASEITSSRTGRGINL